jgi:hypothetical protein
LAIQGKKVLPLGTKLGPEEWLGVAEIIRLLGKDGMSSDSDIEDVDAWAARPVAWRNVQVDQYLEELDTINRKAARKQKPVRIFRGEEARKQKGEDWASRCLRSDQTPVEHLPLSLYNPFWLARQSKAWIAECTSKDKLPLLDGEF